MRFKITPFWSRKKIGSEIVEQDKEEAKPMITADEANKLAVKGKILTRLKHEKLIDDLASSPKVRDRLRELIGKESENGSDYIVVTLEGLTGTPQLSEEIDSDALAAIAYWLQGYGYRADVAPSGRFGNMRYVLKVSW